MTWTIFAKRHISSTDHLLATLTQPRFIGNARLGRDYHIADLRQNYNAVVLSYGASQDRLLNIPNESAKGVLGARAFVSWYNGAPSFSSFDPMLDSTDTAVIVGQGNVALDVARILLTPWEVLAKSDIAERAVEKLKSSRVRRVKIVGRRGPLEVGTQRRGTSSSRSRSLRP